MKKITTLSALFILFSITYQAKAQAKDTAIVAWEKHITNIAADDTISALSNIILSVNKDGFIISGGKEDTSNAASNTGWIAKTDFNGNVIWEQPLNYSYDFLVNQSPIIITSSGQYILLGNGWGQFWNGTDSVWKGYIHLVKINDNGVISWEKTFVGDIAGSGLSNPWGVLGVNLVPVDTNFIVFGLEETSSFLMKFDANGDTLWKKNYLNDSQGRYSKAGITPSNELILLKITYPPDSLIITKMDTSGSILWKKVQPLGLLSWVYSMILKENAWYFFGETEAMPGSPVFVKTDTNGNILEEKYYSYYIFDEAFFIEAGEDTFIFSVQGGYDWDSSPGGSFLSAEDLTFIKINNSGEIISAHSFGDSDKTASAAVVRDSSIVAVGVRKGHAGYLSTWDGYMLNLHYTTLDTTESNILSLLQDNFILYPNPATKTLFIKGSDGAEIKIYDIAGKKVYLKRLKSKERSVNIESLPKGIYIYEIKDKKGQVHRGKFVKQ